MKESTPFLKTQIPLTNMLNSIDLSGIFGPVFFGVVFNWLLLGILIVEVYFYYISFPNDRGKAKWLVVCISALESAQTAFISSAGYQIFASGFGDFETIGTKIDLAIGPLAITGGFVIAMVQIFFAWRVSLLGKTLVLGSLITVISLAQCGLALAFGARMLGVPSGLVELRIIHLLTAWLGCAALCDIVITISMTYLLKRNITGFQRSSRPLSRLMRLTIQSGLICSSGAIAALVLSQLIENGTGGNDFITPTLTLTKLYSINLLAILNSRIKIVGARHYEDAEDLESSNLGFLTRDVEGIPFVIEEQTLPHGRHSALLGSGDDSRRQLTVAMQTNNSVISEIGTSSYIKAESSQ